MAVLAFVAGILLIVADDDVREWGTMNWEEKSEEYRGMGYIPISMKQPEINNTINQ